MHALAPAPKVKKFRPGEILLTIPEARILKQRTHLPSLLSKPSIWVEVVCVLTKNVPVAIHCPSAGADNGLQESLARPNISEGDLHPLGFYARQ
jgi:hypothetical protein